jgi:Zn-dependent M28 family amino/carboxypeptidase
MEAGAVESWEVPGVYFSANISQVRVVEGFVRKAGYFEQFAGYGIEHAEAKAVEQINVITTIPGTISPDIVLEISAHHDTVPGTVGADDNTSSVAVLLEVARLLRENPPACSVRLCFFAAEEIGLRGSQEHVRLLQEQNRLEQVFALINMDGVGHFTDEPNSQDSPIRIPFVVWPPKTGNFLGIIGANGSGWLGDLVVDAGALYAEDLPTYSLARLGGFFPDARRSDHAHYWDLDIPAVFLTDTNDFRTDNYHRPSDDLDSIDMESLRNVAALVYVSAMTATANQAGG